MLRYPVRAAAVRGGASQPGLPLVLPAGLEGDVLDPSTFSENRRGRFRDSDLLRRLFEQVIRRCMAEGLVGGEGFAVEDRGVASIIAPKRNRKRQPVLDGHLNALRNLVEWCFSKLKHSRRLAARYDKTAESYLSFVLIAFARLIRHFVNRT